MRLRPCCWANEDGPSPCIDLLTAWRSLSERVQRYVASAGGHYKFCGLKPLRYLLVFVPEIMNTPSPR